MCIRDRFYTGKVIKDVAIKFDQAGDVFYNRVNQALPKLFEWQELVAISNTVKARLSAHYARQGEDQSQNIGIYPPINTCLLYTSDAADDLLCVDLGGRRIIKKKKLHKYL
eukprot:TRINITY_DN6998_c0_g1_i1.p1 TRINITY_DN6998_c0_g1~~TRINITY_DN6998_c0_g1_i1.p1  ORF type:complete len:111 (+),score=13.99 TRINITY_DN6998_c0_g1_i1:115-447(+)